MTGYVRNDTPNNISDGNVINAADLDGEFDAIVAAFDASTGHTHDGTVGGGAPIVTLGPTQDVDIIAAAVTPRLDNTVDLGSSLLEFKDLWIDGTANIDSLVADTADINAGTIDAVTIGGTTPGAGTFSSLVATTADINAGTIDNTVIGATTPAAITGTTINGTTITASTGFSGNITSTGTSTFSSIDVNGGTIDGVTLGTNSAITQAQIDNININGNAITSTNTNGNIAITPNGTGEVDISKVDIDGGAIDGTVIGGTTPAAVTGTTITASTGFVGNITSTGASTFSNIDVNGGAIDGATIGGATPAAGTFTTATATSFVGPLTGNADTATALQTARTINGTSFNGTANITTANWGTSRTLWGQSVNGSANVTAPLLPAAGSVSAPAFSTSGDTNTGIFFPTADTIAFAEGGSEAMRINSSGNVGIGTTSPAASAILDLSSTTKGFRGPQLTSVQRDAIVSPASGLLIYNTDNTNYELYNGSAWVVVGGGGGYFQGENGAVGQTSGKGDIFRVHEQTLNTNTTIAGTDNAIAAGPLTVASGVTLTVASGGNLVIA